MIIGDRTQNIHWKRWGKYIWYYPAPKHSKRRDKKVIPMFNMSAFNRARTAVYSTDFNNSQRYDGTQRTNMVKDYIKTGQSMYLWSREFKI